jgi:hypothetical protein
MGQDMNETPVGESRTRTPLLFGAVALAAVVAGLLGYFVVVPMFSTGTTDETYVAQRRAPAASASPAPTASATTLKTYRSGTLHDPFKPLVVEPAAGGTSSASGSTASAATSPAPGTAGTATTTPTRVSVVDITTDSDGSAVMVRLDTAIHVATSGETIAGVLKVVAIKGKSATFLYGDASFTLRIGQDKVLS